RYAGNGLHVEVSKERQVLFLVRDGRVTLVVPVSTGATGNTPVGLWHVYSKVPGYNAKEVYYSSFFSGGFAIHGYHSVPYSRPSAEAPTAQLGPRPGRGDRARPPLQHRLLAPDPAHRRAQPRHLRLRARANPVARRTGNAAGHVSVPRAEHARQGEARLRQAGRPMSEHDPLIRQIREQISDNDRAIIEAINTRLKLVARLKSYKESRGMSFVDPEREEWMLQYLARANRGPLSADGLREIFEALLDLTKREV